MAVKAEHTTGMVWKVLQEERLQRCEVDVGGVVPPTQEVRWALVWAEWWKVCKVHFGPVNAVWFLWDCFWASGGLPVASQHLVENGCPWGTGWCCCGCGMALSFQPSFQSIESIMWTLPALAVTPLIKWTWLDILYLTYVFHVVLVPIAIPPPIQLLCYLKCHHVSNLLIIMYPMFLKYLSSNSQTHPSLTISSWTRFFKQNHVVLKGSEIVTHPHIVLRVFETIILQNKALCHNSYTCCVEQVSKGVTNWSEAIVWATTLRSWSEWAPTFGMVLSSKLIINLCLGGILVMKESS